MDMQEAQRFVLALLERTSNQYQEDAALTQQQFADMEWLWGSGFGRSVEAGLETEAERIFFDDSEWRTALLARMSKTMGDVARSNIRAISEVTILVENGVGFDVPVALPTAGKAESGKQKAEILKATEEEFAAWNAKLEKGCALGPPPAGFREWILGTDGPLPSMLPDYAHPAAPVKEKPGHQICATCKGIIAEGDPSKPVSHGMCLACLVRDQPDIAVRILDEFYAKERAKNQ